MSLPCVLEQDTLILVKYWFNPRKTRPYITERLLVGQGPIMMNVNDMLEEMQHKHTFISTLELMLLIPMYDECKV